MKSTVILSMLLAGCGAISSTPSPPPSTSTPMPPPIAAGAIIAGKWEFSNGMNANLVQSGSQITGTATMIGVFASPPNPPGSILVEACTPSAITGQISGLQVTLTQGGVCDTSPAGGYTTEAVVNAAGTQMTGGAWGNAFLVGSVTGTYSGSDVLYEGSQTVSSTGTLILTEDQSQNVIGTFEASPQAVKFPLSGTVVGGCINLSNQILVGQFGALGSIKITADIPPSQPSILVVGTLCSGNCPN